MKTVYLDNNATTAVAPEVLEVMLPFFKDLYGNPSSVHTFGGQVKAHLDTARQQVADLLGAHPEEIYFTSCGSEADNLAIFGTVEAQKNEKRHLITTRVEHPAVKATMQYLEKRGFRVTWLGVDGHGALSLDELRDAITTDTALVSAMWANNETGVIFPIQEMAEICREKGVPFHTDAVQAAGKIPIDVGTLPANFVAISGHKLHAPKGVGALYIRKGTQVVPRVIGGHQERGRRAGTENVAGIIALGKAASLCDAHMNEENQTVRALRDKLEQGILATCKDSVVNGQHRLPNTSNISFKYIEGESILLHLDDLGIAASSGSACTSGSLEPSHVMRAMGVPFQAAHGSVRFSLSRYNTDDEIDYVLQHLPPIIDRLRAISPFVEEE